MSANAIFNKRLLQFIVLICTILLARLIVGGFETENWHGVLISSTHVLVVATGSYLALKRNETRRSAAAKTSADASL